MVQETADHKQLHLLPRDYFTALLQEHALLRDEIKYRSLIDDGFLLACLTAVGVVALTLFSPKESNLALLDGLFSCLLDKSSSSSQVLLCLGLPVVWFGMMTTHVVLWGHIDLLGQAVCIVERKIELLFRTQGSTLLRDSVIQIGQQIHAALKENAIRPPQFWGAPVIWENMIRSRFRLVDKPVLRAVLLFGSAFFLSSIAHVIFMWQRGEWDWCTRVWWMAGYLVLAVGLCVGFARKRVVGRWEWSSIPESVLQGSPGET